MNPQEEAKTNEMMNDFQAIISNGQVDIAGTVYSVISTGKFGATLQGKRKATYTMITCPRAKIIGEPNLNVYSIIGRAGRDCGRFTITEGKAISLGCRL